MVATLATLLLIASSHPAERSVTLTPSDDIWVYPHASDPAGDSFLRIWGSEGKAVSADADHAEFSYSYVRFDLTGIQKGRLKSAHLLLTHVPAQGWTLETVAANPLEVRLLKGDFDEKTWTYEKIDKAAPDPSKDAIVGTGSPEKMPAEGKSAIFDIDLLKAGTFQKILESGMAASPAHLSFALTSRVDPASLGRQSVYKFFSKENADKTVQPTLKLVFED